MVDDKIPEKIAQAIVSPDSYRDEEGTTYPAFKWLRENEPFGQAQVEGYSPFWVAARHADVQAIAKNPAVFSSAAGRAEFQLFDDATSDFLHEVSDRKRMLDTLVTMDAPEHTLIRQVASQWFGAPSVRQREDQIRVSAKEAVAGLLERGRECDFVKDFALMYPLRVMMQLFGVPRSEEATFLKLTQEAFGIADPDEQRAALKFDPNVVARMLRAAIDEFFAYFKELSAERRRRPTNDLASLIANAKINGKHLSDDYVNGYYISIATAGHDTTSSTIAGAGLALARDAAQLAAVREEPSLIPSMIDEALRWTSAVKHFMRTVAVDTEFAGRRLSAGDRVMLSYASANRDAEVFVRPDDFDIHRKPNRHIAFGYGPHMCIGAHVAKLEMRVLFEEFLPQVTAIEQTGPARSVASNFISGLKSLPVSIDRQRRA